MPDYIQPSIKIKQHQQLLKCVKHLSNLIENCPPCKEKQVYIDSLYFLIELQSIKTKELLYENYFD